MLLILPSTGRVGGMAGGAAGRPPEGTASTGGCIVIDTMRSEFPADMMRAAEFPHAGSLEHMANDVVDRVTHYARENPVSFGLWALGIGFVLGWKLKPW